MSASIVLIGPSKAGKTTLAGALGEALNLPVIDLDDLRWGYFAEIGYDKAKAEALLQEGGIRARGVYWKPFEIHSVERVLQDYPVDTVIAFGASNSVYEDDAHLLRAKTALMPFPQVILVLPSADVDASIAIMNRRLYEDVPGMEEDIYRVVADLNRHFITHPSNGRLATFTVYTGDKSVDECCAAIVKRIRG